MVVIIIWKVLQTYKFLAPLLEGLIQWGESLDSEHFKAPQAIQMCSKV